MNASDPSIWMWSEALDMLARAERLQRESFRPVRAADTNMPCWEPPADIFETARDVIIVTALPGVDPASITLSIENGALEIFGRRTLPRELGSAVIHRLELPQGCFRRRLPIPPGAYDDLRRSTENGCLIVALRKFGGR